MRTVSSGMHPDVVWEHNLGVGSPEEGVYRGRDSVVALFERILEPWEYMRAEPREIRDLGGRRLRGQGRAACQALDERDRDRLAYGSTSRSTTDCW